METKAKSNSVITTRIDGSRIVFSILDAGEVILDLSKVHADNKQRAMLHGFVQKVSDRAAIQRDPETGFSASPRDKQAAMQALVDHFESGSSEWRMAGAQRGGAGTGGLLFEALRRAKPEKDAQTIRDFIKGLDKKAQNALINSAALKPHVDAIRAEAGKGVDTDALLSAL